MSMAVSLHSNADNIDNEFTPRLIHEVNAKNMYPEGHIDHRNNDLCTVRTPFLLVATGFAMTQLGILVICTIFVDFARYYVPNISFLMCYGVVGTVIVTMKALAFFKIASDRRKLRHSYKRSVRTFLRPVAVR